MPGLVRMAARTAVVAGTATAVSGRVARRQQGRWAAQEQQQYEHQYYEQANQPVQPVAAAAVPAPATTTDVPTQLRQLAELKQQGVLTDAEFEAQKQKLLAG